jgi:nucleoside-diphosphate kinase
MRAMSSLVLPVTATREMRWNRLTDGRFGVQACFAPGPYSTAVMAIQRTLILCKPDAVSRGLIGEIVSRFERRGYLIVAMKLMQLDGERARRHYGEHEGKPFFQGLVDFITSGPLVAMCVEGEDAIAGCRQLMGATNPLNAAPGSIRADFASTIGRNLVHGSDSHESAERELAIFFEPHDYVTRKHDLERWILEK